jgi:hypothetical protein
MDLEIHRDHITKFLRTAERGESAPIPPWAVLLLQSIGAVLSDQEILDADVAALNAIADDIEAELAALRKAAPGLNFSGLDAIVTRLRGDSSDGGGTAPAADASAPAASAPAPVDTAPADDASEPVAEPEPEDATAPEDAALVADSGDAAAPVEDSASASSADAAPAVPTVGDGSGDDPTPETPAV